MYAHFNPDGEFTFHNDEWNTLLENGGDFASIGVTINSKPVQKFDMYVAREREPREHVLLSPAKE